MNTKKNKNKKQNKPNPNVPPKSEIAANEGGYTEVAEQIIETPEKAPKSDERVPEIISGSAIPSVGESKDAKADTPKKPKRNRGKKKKSDKGDDVDDEKELEATEKICEKENKTVDNESEKTSEIKDKTSDVTVPSSRKKKNKKGEKHGEEHDTFIVSADHPLKVTHLTASEAENVMSDVKMITCVPIATEETEQDSKKKKKNKKKRTDSEKSEKEEFLCTAAFQKIMEPRDDKIDTKQVGEKLEGDQQIKEESELAKEQPPEKTATEKVSLDMILKENIKLTKPEENKAEDTSKPLDKGEDNKNKKKNKKDKRHPLKSESGDESAKTPEPRTEELEKITPTDIKPSFDLDKLETNKPGVAIDSKPEIKEDVPKLEESKSPKLKAKIAKPVEKKSKEPKDVKHPEMLSEALFKSTVEKEPSGTDKKLDAKKNPEQKPEQKPTEIADWNIMEETADKNKKDQKTIKENIPLPDQSAAKKRKKSPKPQKRIEDMKSEEKIVEMNVESKMEVVAKQETIDISSLMPIKEVEELQKEPSEKTLAEQTIKTKHMNSPPKVKPIPESTLEKEHEVEKPKAIPLPFTTTEILQSAEPLKTLEAKSVTEPEKSQETAAKQKDKASETEILQHIPSPDGGMGKKRGKSPKPKRDVAPDFKKPEEDAQKTDNRETFISETVKPAKESSKTEKSDDKPQLIPANLSLFKDKSSIKQDKDTCEPSSSKKCDDSKKAEEVILKRYKVCKVEPTVKDVISDIDDCSVKTEEPLSSIPDVAPVIDHPRSSSQSADDNNNLFIRDITAEENMPSAMVTRKLETPIIQDSAPTPFLEAISIVRPKKEERTQSKQSKEKTDIKSKMMEVNQDMEGLRKSIEKSLAELSAIEKSEKGNEEQFIQAQSKLEQIKDLALKQHANIKQNIALTTSDAEDESKTQKRHGTEVPLTKKKFPDSEKISTVAEKLEPLVPKMSETVERKKTEEESLVLDPTKTPEPPARKDNKGKGKSKRKGKQETEQSGSQRISGSDTKDTKTQEIKPEEKPDQKTEKSEQKGKQQACASKLDADVTENSSMNASKSGSEQFEPIENFEDALTSSVDDVNKTFEIIANDAKEIQNNPEINITAPTEEKDERDKDKKDRQATVNPVSQPKNLLGRPEIPARSNKMDYKKEKNKTPNSQQAKVKLKDVSSLEKAKISKDTQTEKKRLIKDNKDKEVISTAINDSEEYVYKYSFRRVFLPNTCHVCKIELKEDRVQCNFCNLVFYCSLKHKDQDSTQHEAFCFAVSTIMRLKDQKHLYQNSANITGHDYRLLRMQMIVSCEKILKRRLEPCEQEMLLYPRVCADAACREWRQEILKDCEGCGQISHCTTHHPPASHQKWCKSYSLYHKLVTYQQIKGRLEPKLPTKVMSGVYQIPRDMNEVLAAMYEEKIDMSDIQYAALTQVATAPLTAAYCFQLYSEQMNANCAYGVQKKSTFTIHVVGAELQFEADALNKWEVFFLHLRPDVSELRIVLIGPDLNPGNLPLDLLAKIRLCENCNLNKRRVVFDFQDKKNYNEYWSTDFITPDLVCTFNPSIQRSSILNGKDTWPSTIRCIFKQKTPFIITSYTMNELHRDLARIKEFSKDFNVVSEPKFNSFASVRPDRNFISDDEMPLLFKNYCVLVVCSAF